MPSSGFQVPAGLCPLVCLGAQEHIRIFTQFNIFVHENPHSERLASRYR